MGYRQEHVLRDRHRRPTKVYAQFGQIFKNLGVTNLAALGYGVSPSSSEAAKGIAIAAQLLGIKVGYLNTNVPFGTTNVGPFALAMKSDGVNGMSAEILTSTEFTLINQLRQEGVNMRGVVSAQGYGGDLYSGGPAGERTAQGLISCRRMSRWRCTRPRPRSFRTPSRPMPVLQATLPLLNTWGTRSLAHSFKV